MFGSTEEEFLFGNARDKRKVSKSAWHWRIQKLEGGRAWRARKGGAEPPAESRAEQVRGSEAP